MRRSYVGKWDPTFGPDFPDLGWKGEAKFFVPNACLVPLRARSSTAESCSNFRHEACSVGRVDFYKVSDPTNATFQESILFDTPSPLVTWVHDRSTACFPACIGSFDYLVAATLPLAGGPDTEFVLFFEDTIARLGFVSNRPRRRARVQRSARRHHVSARARAGQRNSLALALAAMAWLSRRRPGFCQRK